MQRIVVNHIRIGIKLMEKFRKIKIQDKYEKRKWDTKLVPSLKLQGEWLRAAGFTGGENCTIKVERGRLTILSI